MSMSLHQRIAHEVRPGLGVLIVVAVYGLLCFALATISGKSLDGLWLTPQGDWTDPLRVVAMGLGYAIAMFLPGSRAVSFRPNAGWPDFAVRAFFSSIALNALSLTALKLLGFGPLGRSGLIGAAVISTVLATIIRASRDCSPSPPALTSDERAGLGAAGGLIAVLAGLFWSKIFFEGASGDGTECFEFANSLRTHLLPVWDLENGTWGAYPAFMSFAFPKLLSILNVGPEHAAARLPAIIYAGVLVLVVPRAAGIKSPSPLLYAVVATTVLSLCVFSFYYATWNAMAADIAEPSATDLWSGVCVLAAIYFLARREPLWFIATAVAAMSAVVSGIAITGLVAAAYLVAQPTRSDRIKVAAMSGGALLGYGVVVLLARTTIDGVEAFSDQFEADAVAKTYLSAIAGPKLILKKAANIVLILGGIIVVPILWRRPPSREAVANLAIAVGYTAVILLAGRSNAHYLMLPALLILVVGVRQLTLTNRPRVWMAAQLVGVIVALALVVPVHYPLFTGSRDFADRTWVEGDNYRERVKLARVIYGLIPWPNYAISHHTLVQYNEAYPVPQERRDYLISARAMAPEGYRRLRHAEGAYLYVRPTAAAVPWPDPPRTWARSLPLRLTRWRDDFWDWPPPEANTRTETSP